MTRRNRRHLRTTPSAYRRAFSALAADHESAPVTGSDDGRQSRLISP
jgi:hypothetical protein